MTPDGEQLDQSIANQYSTFENIIILCDITRVLTNGLRDYYITHELSIGDFVLQVAN